jgi:hypothetical protein
MFVGPTDRHLKAFIAVESRSCVSWASNPVEPIANAAITKMTFRRAMFEPFLEVMPSGCYEVILCSYG